MNEYLEASVFQCTHINVRIEYAVKAVTRKVRWYAVWFMALDCLVDLRTFRSTMTKSI